MGKHWNPWESIDKASFLKMLERIKHYTEVYSKYQVGIDLLIPKRVSHHLAELKEKVEKCDKVWAYFSEARDVYTALQVLDNPRTKQSSASQAKAFGMLFVAVSKMLAHVSGMGMYAEFLEEIGKHFEGIVGVYMPAGYNDPAYADIWASIHQ